MLSTVKAAFITDRLVGGVLVTAGVSWAAFQYWLKHASSFVVDIIPFATLALILTTIFVRFSPRPVPDKGDKSTVKEAVRTFWRAHRKTIWLGLAAVLTLGGALYFMSRRASAAPVGDASGGTPDTATDGGDTGHKLFDFARTFIGTPEKLLSGKCNPAVLDMGEAVANIGKRMPNGRWGGWDCRKVAWCSIGMNFWAWKKGLPRSRSAMARSWLRVGQKTTTPERGDAVVMWRGSHDDGETGHVGLFDSFVQRGRVTYVRVLGCNQGDKVSFELFPVSRVLGYRRLTGVRARPAAEPVALTTGGTSAGSIGVGTDMALNGQGDAVTPHAPSVVDHIEAARAPLEQAASFLPQRYAGYALITLGVIGLGLSVYMWINRHN